MSLISERVKRLRERAETIARSKEYTEDIVQDFNETADLIEEISAKLSARNLEESSRYYNKGWIPCKERLPERGVLVLTCDRNGWISVNVNNSYGSIKNDFECGYYEAWMPLPEPYKEKQT